MRAVDLFAGPGGWDLAAMALDIDVIGIENDANTCRTRRAAGLRTLEKDVRHFGYATFSPNYPDPFDGLIASPPCQTFSMAGKGSGRRALDTVIEHAEKLDHGGSIDPFAFEDDRTGLILEPLRWAIDAWETNHPYRWIALEQVPTVLPVWECFADALRRRGYVVATGRLSAEQYGVPQTRKRAFLVARLQEWCELPPATHRPYRKGVSRADGDERLQPWVSMADALGWPADDQVGFPRLDDTDGHDAVEIHGRTYRARDLRPADDPAFNLTEKARSWARLRNNTSENAAERDLAEPAPTMYFGERLNSMHWLRMSDFPRATVRHIDEPAPTVMFGKAQGETRWADGQERRRITQAEAAVLQGFPADYPWQGSMTAQFRQVGNAIPPPLAYAVLQHLLEGPRS